MNGTHTHVQTLPLSFSTEHVRTRRQEEREKWGEVGDEEKKQPSDSKELLAARGVECVMDVAVCSV